MDAKVDESPAQQAKRYAEMLAEMIAKQVQPELRPGYLYRSQYHYLLEKAKLYEPRPMTPVERDKVADLCKVMAVIRPQVKECYLNAFHAATAGLAHGFVYAEGLGMHIIPVNHAWVDLNGLPIDFTWRDFEDASKDATTLMNRLKSASKKDTPTTLMERVERNMRERGYFGFTVPFTYLGRIVRQKNACGSLLDDWENEWPLLREGFDFEKSVPPSRERKKKKRE